MLIPFWNTYIALFPDNVAIRVCLSGNMVLVGLFFYLSLNYAGSSAHRLLHSSVTETSVKQAKGQILTEPGIAILAAGLAFIHPVLWDIAFILVPLLFVARKKLVTVKYFKFIKS